jgi:predicted short-subunit dehydrogenase-like oxidoreductase (DUF2520 family)
LTGPISRGDLKVVKDPVNQIQAQAPELLELYKLLGRHTVDIAEFKKSISQDTVELLKKLLI